MSDGDALEPGPSHLADTRLDALIARAAAAVVSMEQNSAAMSSLLTSATETQEQVSAALTDARATLQDISSAATQAATAKAQISEAQIPVEQHARNAAAAIAAATEAQTQTGAAMAEAQAKLQEISSVATQAAAAKANITDAQAVIATKSDHIDGAQKHADKVRGDMDRALTATQANVTETDGLKTRAAAIVDGVTQLQAAVAKSKADADSNAEAIRKSFAAAKEAADAAKKLADIADQVEHKLSTYEATLADLQERSDSQLKTIVGLLPGATSAGLASAFDGRRQTFLEPSRRWQWWFVGSVIALIVLGVTGLLQLYIGGNETLTYEKLLRIWLARIPVAAALVWLALYTSREAALAKRLEEDYGYKSAVAASFQGFQKQMQEVAATVGADSPLGKLCHDTLIAIASPPGRIYDKHALTVSPSGEIKELAGALIEAIGKAAGKSQ
jgi:hypothetical protein